MPRRGPARAKRQGRTARWPRRTSVSRVFRKERAYRLRVPPGSIHRGARSAELCTRRPALRLPTATRSRRMSEGSGVAARTTLRARGHDSRLRSARLLRPGGRQARAPRRSRPWRSFPSEETWFPARVRRLDDGLDENLAVAPVLCFLDGVDKRFERMSARDRVLHVDATGCHQRDDVRKIPGAAVPERSVDGCRLELV